MLVLFGDGEHPPHIVALHNSYLHKQTSNASIPLLSLASALLFAPPNVRRFHQHHQLPQTLDLIFPRRQLPASPPSLVRLVLEVMGAIAVYDVAFFVWHTTVHRHPALYRRVHAKHHQCYVQRAPEVRGPRILHFVPK